MSQPPNTLTAAPHRQPRIVILGAGFSGLWAAKDLANAPVEVWIVDKNNYHTFFPLLYQVAAAELTPGEVAQPVRTILWDRPNVHFVMANIDRIDLENHQVAYEENQIDYDYLVIALGSKPNYYQIPGAAENAFSLKSMEQALTLRNHILECFERASTTKDEILRKLLLTFVVTGGGQTGVEFAGAFSELIRGPLSRDYPEIAAQAQILLFETNEQLLAGQPRALSTYTLKRLKKMNVKVFLKTPVELVTSTSLQYGGGQMLSTATVVWTAGVKGVAENNSWGLPTNHQGQIPVLPTLQVPGYNEVYCAGDLADMQENGTSLPMVAQTAIQEGTWAAKNIARQVNGGAPQPFQYHDPGTISVIGRNAAAVNIHGIHLTGFPAWLIWLVVHLVNLMGFRAKLIAIIDWAFDYFFSVRGIRLIVPYVPTINQDLEEKVHQKSS